MAATDLAERIASVRRFNRIYTGKIGVLQRGYLDSPYSLTEVRVLYELAHRPETTAAELCRELGLDPGYASRLLRSFEKGGLVERRRSGTDGRLSLLRLTPAGRAAYAPLNDRSDEQVAGLLEALEPADQRRLVAAMDTIESLLGPRSASAPADPWVLRPHRPGDMGWVVHRHGLLYAEEYGWNEEFEALVADIVAQFVRGFDPQMERCWIAERDGEILGSVFLVKGSQEVAKLRLLLVEPAARGTGLGTRLVEECVAFARERGYRKVTLWTNSVLHAARRIYEKTGFALVREEPHHSFGKDLVGQTWEREL